MNTGTVNLSQSTQSGGDGSEWVSNWERELAWDATFGNRSRLPWPYRTTSLRHVLGDDPGFARQLGEAFAELREPFNALSHLVGVCLALVALVVMTTAAGVRGGTLHVACAAVFGGSLVVAYLISALHHSLRVRGPLARALARADQASRAVLVAGTLVPLCLIGPGGLDGAIAWVAGGLFYAFALISKHATGPSAHARVRGHEVAHLLMIAGSACHVWAVIRYCLPLA